MTLCAPACVPWASRSTASSSTRVSGIGKLDICVLTCLLGPAAGSEWCIYDVGGSRTQVRSGWHMFSGFCLTQPLHQRIAWYPYFDDCDAIIFLAPISCFDERLAEDRRINRLEDSYMLWKAVVSSKLLARTSIILFLNKSDLLEAKLRGGVRVRDYVQSFGDRPNNLENAVKCKPSPCVVVINLTGAFVLQTSSSISGISCGNTPRNRDRSVRTSRLSWYVSPSQHQKRTLVLT